MCLLHMQTWCAYQQNCTRTITHTVHLHRELGRIHLKRKHLIMRAREAATTYWRVYHQCRRRRRPVIAVAVAIVSTVNLNSIFFNLNFQRASCASTIHSAAVPSAAVPLRGLALGSTACSPTFLVYRCRNSNAQFRWK